MANKRNVKMPNVRGLEVYCTRPYFNFNCNSTPNNCTECHMLRFLYHDLLERVLDQESADALKTIVEKSEVFSGKFDGRADGLPETVWNAIYTIREICFRCGLGNPAGFSFNEDKATEVEGYLDRDKVLNLFAGWRAAKTTRNTQ